MAQSQVTSQPEVDRGLWTVPNAISILRPIAIIPALIKLSDSIDRPTRAWWSFVIAGIILGLDVVDGWIARHYHQTSRIGKLIDPTADKLVGFTCLGFMLVVLSNKAGTGFFAALLGIVAIRLVQDLVSFFLYVRDWKANQVKGSNFPGKVKTWAELIGSALGLAWLMSKGSEQANISALLVIIGCSISAGAATISLRRKLTSR